jgi:hypothetical protein
MKAKIIYIVLGFALFQTSCTELLDLNPLDTLSEPTFWQKEADFDNALAACYATLQHENFALYMDCWDNATDNSYGKGNVLGMIDIVAGSINTNTGGIITSLYSRCYYSVARINIFLAQLNDFPGISDTKKRQYEAEVRMLRSFYYSFLYRCYGEVPVVSEPLNLETMIKAKSTKAEVLNFLIQDLDFAITNLPNMTYAESKGHWTVNAAKAYKARILLYDAYDSSGNAIVTQMNVVKELLTGITGYRLADDFSDNFQDMKQESCPEIMMSVRFLAPNNYHNWDFNNAHLVRISPLINFISEFDMADGSPGQPIPSDGPRVDIDVFTNTTLETEREPRAAKTVYIDKYKADGVEYFPGDDRPLGTGCGKFMTPELVPYGVSTRSQQDFIILRYADVLLMLAEVENELNGPTALVYESVNAIRERGKTSLLPAGLTKDQMRERIRHERRIELAFEGHRYFDLKRWKIAGQVLSNVTDGVVTYRFEDKHYLWPLPQAEIDKSQGVLVQNPDYQ